jgi:hypothetical protein
LTLATIDIILLYGLTKLPYPSPLSSYNFNIPQPNKLSISRVQDIYSHGNDSKQNHKVLSELFTTIIELLLLIQLSIGMNSSLHTHVLSNTKKFHNATVNKIKINVPIPITHISLNLENFCYMDFINIVFFINP